MLRRNLYLGVGVICFLFLIPSVTATTDEIGDTGHEIGFGADNLVWAGKIRATSSGTLQSIGLKFVEEAQTEDLFVVGIYADGGASPTGSPLTFGVATVPASGGWADVTNLTSFPAITENTMYWLAMKHKAANTLAKNESAGAGGKYKWPYGWDGTLPDPWSETGSTVGINMRMTYEVPNDAPQWATNLTQFTSPQIYEPSRSFGFQVTWTDTEDGTYNFSFFEHNFTGTMANYTTTRSGNVSSFNFTGIGGGEYFFRFYANDSSDKWNATDQWALFINRSMTTATLLIDGTDGNINLTQNDTANFTIIINVTGLLAQLDSNYTGFGAENDTTPFTNLTYLFTAGVGWNMTGYFDGDENYTYSSVTHWFNVTELPYTPPPPEYGISIALIEENRGGLLGWLIDWLYKEVIRFGFVINNLKMGGYNITDMGHIEMSGNITLISPNDTSYNCGVDNYGNFTCK